MLERNPMRAVPVRHTALCAALALVLPATGAFAAQPFAALPAVEDARLAAVRGGFTHGGLDMFFGISREVLVNGQVVAVTQLVIGNLDRLAAGGLPTVQSIGNALLLVQSGAGNVAPGIPVPAASTSTSLAAPGSTPAAQSVANAGSASMAAAPAPSAPQGAQTPTPAATAPQMGAPSLAPATANTPSASSSTLPNPSLPPAAALAGGGGPVAVTPLNVAGQIIVLPSAAAIIIAVQASMNDQLIQTRTQIDATLNALSALRSGEFAAALRAQTQGSLRP